MNLHIKRLALQAGCHHATVTDKYMKHWRCTNKDLERFAALVLEEAAILCREREDSIGEYGYEFSNMIRSVTASLK